MEPIQASLKRWMDENKDFQQRYSVMKAEILRDPTIQEFLTNHPEITDGDIHKRLNKLYEYITQSKQCEQCNSFHGCKNILKGYSPVLQWANGEIHLTYEKCTHRIQYEKRIEKSNLIQSLYMPKEILQAKISDIHYDSHR